MNYYLTILLDSKKLDSKSQTSKKLQKNFKKTSKKLQKNFKE